jgi:putative intracellular protease/amidase
MISVLVFDGFADWEPAFAMTGLRRWGNRDVRVVGYDRSPVTSMGGLSVTPTATLEDAAGDDAAMLILPGGDAWIENYPAVRVEAVIRSLMARRVRIAGICAATVALARAGCFRGRRHTSNGAAFLAEQAPGYETASLYQDTLAVSDDGVISASGLGAIEFAREIFAALGVFGEADLDQYVAMYRRGESVPG